MNSPAWRRARYALLVAVILVFFISLAAAVYDQRRRTDIYENTFRNTSWTVAQLERELLQFDSTLVRYAAGLREVDHEDLVIQFEIFWSRIPIILNGSEGSVVRELPGTVETLETLVAALERIEPLVYGLERGDRESYKRIARQLEPLIVPLHEIVQQTMVYTEGQGQALTAGKSIFRVSVFLFGILASGSILIIMLLRDRARVAQLAYHDPLTGLPNRGLFEDRLKQAMASTARRGQIMALHYIDVDHFKDVNDTLGHKAGDQLLVLLGEQFAKTVRETDTVARVSGDEFAVIQSDLSGPEDAVALAERLITAASRPVTLNERIISTGCSIGLATYQGESLNPEELPMRADVALYRAKAEGRSTYRFYDRDMDTSVRDRIEIRDQLASAIKRDELVLHYQPQMRLSDRQIVCVESLLRWRNGDGRLRGPMEFIPVAEDSNLIVDIGEWVLRSACEQAKAWQEAGLPWVPVSVNMSPEQFFRSNVFESVARILAETGLEAGCLEIEITENVFLDRSEQVFGALDSLHELGVRISLDDFGTGYCSLGYLKSFPVDKLKIDRRFLDSDMDSNIDAAIVKSIIYIANQMGLDVTGEGIETAEHARWLQEHGCLVGQGFHLCRPCDAAQLQVFWKERLDAASRGVDSQQLH